MSERRIELDTVCPMCKKHKTIAVFDIDTTVYRGVDVEYPRVTFFCSTLGEDDDDAYFMHGTLWDINTSMMQACYYRTGAGMKEAMKYRINDFIRALKAKGGKI